MRTIQVTVVVVVTPGVAGAVAGGQIAVGHVGERAVPVVPVEKLGAQIIGHIQVEVAVVVVIRPGRAVRRPAIRGHDAVGDRCEGSVAIVAIEKIVARRRHEQIQGAVIVKITPGGAAGIYPVMDNGTFSDPGESAVAVVTVEVVVLAKRIGHEQIEPAIVVVVGPRTTRRTTDIIDDVADSDLREIFGFEIADGWQCERSE